MTIFKLAHLHYKFICENRSHSQKIATLCHCEEPAGDAAIYTLDCFVARSARASQ